MKLVIDTPGISTGYWNERNSPSWARSSGFMARRSLPLNTAVPPVTSYNGLPTSTALSVDFPEPFGPMMAWVSPSLMVRLIPFNISLLPILACKSLTSNIITNSSFLIPNYPTVPSSDTLSNFCASTANSIGSLLSTCLAYPLTISPTACSVGMPRWLQ